VHLQRTLVFRLNLAQWALVHTAQLLHLVNVPPYSELAQNLAAGLADESSSSWHHVFINERLHYKKRTVTDFQETQ
jgi:hypothetical protein